MTSATLIAPAAATCFAHLRPEKVTMKARVVAAAFADVPLAALKQMSLAHLLAHLTDHLPCVVDLGTTHDCLARTILRALHEPETEEDSDEDSGPERVERPRKRTRGEAAQPAKKPRPEDPFDAMHAAALAAILRSPSTAVHARLALAVLHRRYKRLLAYRRAVAVHLGARARALTIEQFGARSVADLAALGHEHDANGFQAAAQCALALHAHLLAHDGTTRSPYTLTNATLSYAFGIHDPTANLRRCAFPTLARLVAMPPVSADDLHFVWDAVCEMRNRRSAMARALEVLGADVATEDINTLTVLALARAATTEGEAATLCALIVSEINMTRPLQARMPGCTSSAQLYEALGATCTVAELCGVPCDDATRNVRYVPTGDTDSDSE